jgi:hypothetical protein
MIITNVVKIALTCDLLTGVFDLALQDIQNQIASTVFKVGCFVQKRK